MQRVELLCVQLTRNDFLPGWRAGPILLLALLLLGPRLRDPQLDLLQPLLVLI